MWCCNNSARGSAPAAHMLATKLAFTCSTLRSHVHDQARCRAKECKHYFTVAKQQSSKQIICLIGCVSTRQCTYGSHGVAALLLTTQPMHTITGSTPASIHHHNSCKQSTVRHSMVCCFSREAAGAVATRCSSCSLLASPQYTLCGTMCKPTVVCSQLNQQPVTHSMHYKSADQQSKTMLQEQLLMMRHQAAA